MPTHTSSSPCTRKISPLRYTISASFSPDLARCQNIKELDMNGMPCSGDVMVYRMGTTLGQTREFDAQFQVLVSPT